jgi:hypothetical protein
MESELRFQPQHFESEFWLIPIFCEKEKTAIDVGANEGEYFYYVTKSSRNVIAFELPLYNRLDDRDRWRRP